MIAQKADDELIKKFKKVDSDLHVRTYHAAGKKRMLICKNKKIYIPTALRTRIVEWYHEQLCHPGEIRTALTISQHFTWPNLHDDVKRICSTCHTCQLTKRHTKKYGYLPPKEAESEPWVKLCVDLIGPYKIKRKRKTPLMLWAVTMIDPATGWFEIKQLKAKSADVVANEKCG